MKELKSVSRTIKLACILNRIYRKSAPVEVMLSDFESAAGKANFRREEIRHLGFPAIVIILLINVFPVFLAISFIFILGALALVFSFYLFTHFYVPQYLFPVWLVAIMYGALVSYRAITEMFDKAQEKPLTLAHVLDRYVFKRK